MSEENTNQKGGKITEGMANDEELMASSDSILEGGKSGHGKGLQQHFTPKPVAAFIGKVMNSSQPVIDLTAGDGSLLSGWDERQRFGVEIDGDQKAQGDYRGFKGDIQHAFPILRTVFGEHLPAVALNPPYSLEWDVPGFDEVGSSTKLAFLMGNELLSNTGQGVLICGKERFDREILPSGKGHFYAILETNELWDDVALDVVIAFWVKTLRTPWGFRGDTYDPTPLRREVSLHELRVSAIQMIQDVQSKRQEFNRRAGGYNSIGAEWINERMKAAAEEHQRRLGKRLTKANNHDVWTAGGKTRVTCSGYTKLILSQHDELRFVESLRKLPLIWFAQNLVQWRKLVRLADEEKLLLIDPLMREKVEDLVRDTEMLLVPMYEIKKQQRLAWVASEGLEELECIKTDEAKGFVLGQNYKVICYPDQKRTEIDRNRPVVSEKTGEAAMKNFRITRKYLKIVVYTEDRRRHEFGEDKTDIEYLCDHFNLPDPGTIESKFPAEIAEKEKLIQELQDGLGKSGRFPYTDEAKGWVKGLPNKWAYKPFQKMDLARLMFKGSGLLAWEQGLGKTLAGWTFIEGHFATGDVQKCALIVAPRDLIENWSDEYELWFGKRPQVITDYDQAREIAQELKDGGEGVYITHYECLSRRGRKEELTDYEWSGERWDTLDEDGELVSKGFSILGSTANIEEPWTEQLTGEDGLYNGEVVKHERKVERHPITVETRCPKCGAPAGAGFHPRVGKTAAFCEATQDDSEWQKDVDPNARRNGYGKKCNYVGYDVRVRSIGNVLSVAFRQGVIVFDELTWLKGNTSERSKVARGLNAKFVLGLTGTPIKNYVRDAFWGLWRCLGNESVRFPYGYDGATNFENDFCVIEQELNSSGNVQNRKVKAEVTNLAKLWRLLSASIIRRLKEETGEDLVPRVFYPVVCPLGVSQQAQTQAWLKGFATFFSRENPDHPVVLSGAVDFMAPLLGQLAKLEYAATCPEADPDRDYWNVKVSNWTPKNAKTLEIAMHHAARGQKVLVGSCTLANTAWIAEQLKERGVKTETMLVEDNEGPPKSKEAIKRGQIVKKFQAGDAQVLSAGVAAMAYGHNLDAGSVIILNGLPWDYASLNQFIARCHRLTSKNKVSIYIMLSEGTLDEKKWKLLVEKGDAANLALDGRLIEEQEAPIAKEEVIREMAKQGIPVNGNEVSEGEIVKQWEGIKSHEDLPEFVQPEPVEVLKTDEVEETDAIRFERERRSENTVIEEETLDLAGSWTKERDDGVGLGGDVREDAEEDVPQGEVDERHPAPVEEEEAVVSEEEAELPAEAEQAPVIYTCEERPNGQEARKRFPSGPCAIKWRPDDTGDCWDCGWPQVDHEQVEYHFEEEHEDDVAEAEANDVEELVTTATKVEESSGQGFFDFDF